MYEDRWKDRKVNKIYHKIQKHTERWSRCRKENVEWKVRRVGRRKKAMNN